MLLDTDGRVLSSTKRQIQISDPRIARVAANVDDVFRQLHLTVVCVHCGETPGMGNHPTDMTWKMECSCSKRTLINPDRRVQ